MWPFRRQSKPAKPIPVPEEIKAYYESEKRQQTWKIWLFSAATFAVTLLVVLGLFWGGRWTYRHFQNKSNNLPVATSSSSSTPKASDSKPSAPAATPAPNPTPNPAPAPTPAAQSTPAPASTPSSSSQLIDTGPGNVDL